MIESVTGTKEVSFKKNGIRYARVKNHDRLLVDQYGRVFDVGSPSDVGFDSDGLRLTTILGSASH